MIRRVGFFDLWQPLSNIGDNIIEQTFINMTPQDTIHFYGKGSLYLQIRPIALSPFTYFKNQNKNYPINYLDIYDTKINLIINGIKMQKSFKKIKRKVH